LIALSTLRFPAYAGASDLAVESIWLEKVSAPGVPVAATDLPLDESFNIVASIKNLGQETASGYYLDVYYDNDYGRGGPDNITAGEVQEWYVGPLTALAGTHTTQWVVDPDNLIAELNESNNLLEYTFTIGQETTTTTTGTSTVQTTQVLTSTGTMTVTGYRTTTVTSYTGTMTSTSTVVVPASVTTGPSAMTSTVQTTQFVTSTGTMTVTGYRTTTVTSYVGTVTSTSTVVVPASVTTGPSASTLTVQTTQVLTSTGTTTMTGHTTRTVTSYTGTETSTSTSVVYTTVTSLASAGTSSPLVYIGFLSLLGVTVGRRVTAAARGQVNSPIVPRNFLEPQALLRDTPTISIVGS